MILTGGDPLMLSARRLAALMARLARIEHVKVVRFHTRVPVADPAMITPALVASMKSPTQATFVALHANHPRELTPAARAACARIIDAGMPMLSQTVLLAGVNDDAAVLGELMRALVETRVKPYYLHHGDLAPGTAHFRTSLAAGQALMRQLRGDLSGLCQPTYMLDLPGGHGKVPVGPGYVAGDLDGCASVEARGRHPRLSAGVATAAGSQRCVAPTNRRHLHRRPGVSRSLSSPTCRSEVFIQVFGNAMDGTHERRSRPWRSGSMRQCRPEPCHG